MWNPSSFSFVLLFPYYTIFSSVGRLFFYCTTTQDEVLASVRVYREGRHGSQRWENLAAFSEATDLFRFRCIPGLAITTDQFIVCDGSRYDIVSVEDVKGRGMYVEVLAKKIIPSK